MSGFGRESGTGPIHVATPQTDLSAELKRGLTYLRREHSTGRKFKEGDGRIWHLTRQELAELLPHELQAFLDHKYGIVPTGRTPVHGRNQNEQKQNAP
jgi:hypothetical protein